MKIHIDWNESGFSLKDFNGMASFEKKLIGLLDGSERVGDEVHIPRNTHSTAEEFFEITKREENLIHLKHTGGVS